MKTLKEIKSNAVEKGMDVSTHEKDGVIDVFMHPKYLDEDWKRFKGEYWQACIEV